MGPERHEVTLEHVSPGDPDAATDGQEDDLQVGGGRAVAVHVDAQIGVKGGPAGGEEPTHLAHLLEVEFANPHGGPGVKILKPWPDLLESIHVTGNVIPVVPALLQDHGDHGPGEKGVGPRSHRQVDVRDGRGLRAPGVDHDEDLVGVFGEAGKETAGLGYLVALHAVPPHGQQHLRVLMIGCGEEVLATCGPSPAPEVAGQVINLAGGGRTNLLQLIDYLERILDRQIAVEFLPPQPGDVKHSMADISSAKKHLGYNPQVNFEEGLSRTVGWYQSSR